MTALAIPVAQIVIRGELVTVPMVILSGVLVVAALAMIDIRLLVTASRSARPFVPGASKEVSGETDRAISIDPDDLEKKLKIVVPDISPKNNFAIDYESRYVDGSAYFILLKDDSINNYKFTLDILNSYIAECYY